MRAVGDFAKAVTEAMSYYQHEAPDLAARSEFQTILHGLAALERLGKTIAPVNPAVPKANDIYQGKETAPIPNNPYSHFVAEAIAKGGPLARFITDG